MEQITVTPIGVVRVDEAAQATTRWRSLISHIEVDEAYAQGLDGLENWSHIVVIFSMHETKFDPETDLHNRPEGQTDMPETGVFAQRSHRTPNTLGMTTVKIKSIDGNVLTVQGLDANDGTPVLDIKPYAPVYDGAPDPLVPVWFLRLMQS